MKRGAVVKCIKKFKDQAKHPFIIFPRLNYEYIIRDIIIHSDGSQSYRLFEIKNEEIKTGRGVDEPSFNSNNFEILRMPMNADEVIKKALKNKD